MSMLSTADRLARASDPTYVYCLAWIELAGTPHYCRQRDGHDDDHQALPVGAVPALLDPDSPDDAATMAPLACILTWPRTDAHAAKLLLLPKARINGDRA
jgi:hypothetical protein